MPSSQSIAPDLGSTVNRLASSMQTAMASLYSLQTSSINAQGSNPPEMRQLFVQIRTPLRQEWEATLAFLQKCVAFGGDVITLKNSLTTESIEDCVEFLMDMSSTSTALLGELEIIVQKHGEATKVFADQVPRLTELFQRSAERVPVEHFADSSASRDPILPWKEPPAVSDPPIRDRGTQSFVKANMDAIRPDGRKSLSDTEIALAEISSNLDTIHRFWKLTSEACKGFLSQSSARGLNITLQEANRYAEVWRSHREGLDLAIISVAKSSDAIMVEAIGAPPPRLPAARPASYSPRDNHYQKSRSYQGGLNHERSLPPRSSPTDMGWENSRLMRWWKGEGM